jgi:hypothetical protein
LGEAVQGGLVDHDRQAVHRGHGQGPGCAPRLSFAAVMAARVRSDPSLVPSDVGVSVWGRGPGRRLVASARRQDADATGCRAGRLVEIGPGREANGFGA